ncbi:MAG: MFS transporter [Candidatus Binataceae bacterium]|nr:MFS transporter [Candidatus Binataceae bacterium]
MSSPIPSKAEKAAAASQPSRWWPEWLKHDLLYLLAGRAIRSFAQGYLLIIVPLYLSMLGYDAEHLGILFAASAATSAILVAAIGVLSDRFGRKTLLILISLMTAGGGVVFALSSNFLVLVAGAALGTIGRGGGVGSGGAWGPYYPAEQALIAEQASDRQRTTIFGVISFVGVIASALGSLLAYMPQLMQRFAGLTLIDGYRGLFALTALLGIAMALIVLPVHESHRHAHPEPRSRHPQLTPQRGPRRLFGISLSRESWHLISRFMITNSINGLAIGMLGPFIVYWFYRRYGVGAGTLGGLFFFMNLIAAVPYLSAGRLAARMGAVGAVVWTRGISVILLLVLAVMPTFTLAAIVFGIRMVFNTLSLPVRQSYLMGVIRPSERASAAGLANLPMHAASSVTPYFAGYLMQYIALSLPLEIAAVLMGLNTALYYIFFRNIRPPEEIVAEQANSS